MSLPKVLRLAMPLRCDTTSSLMLAVSAVDELLLRRRFAAMDLGSSFPIPLDWLVGVSIVAALRRPNDPCVESEMQAASVRQRMSYTIIPGCHDAETGGNWCDRAICGVAVGQISNIES